MFYRKPQKYKIDITAANATLQNVFAACEQAPNTIPFDKLLLRQKANCKKYNILLSIVSFLLVITLLSPLTIIPVSNLIAPTTDTLVSVAEHHVSWNVLYLHLSGTDIHYEDSYLITSGGQTYAPLSYDDASQTICFDYIDEECNIYIPYGEGKQLHLLLTPKAATE